MKLRFAVILAVVLVLFVYVGWKLAQSFGRPATTLIMVVFFLGFGFYRKFHGLKNPRARRFLVNAVHLEMGFPSSRLRDP